VDQLSAGVMARSRKETSCGWLSTRYTSSGSRPFDPPGAVDGAEHHVPRSRGPGRGRQGSGLVVVTGGRDDRGEPDPLAIDVDGTDPDREHLARIAGIGEPADGLIAGEGAVGQRLEASPGRRAALRGTATPSWMSRSAR
jgi:hypothetical protein